LKHQRAPRSQRGMTLLGLTLATAVAALLVVLKVLARRRWP